MRTPVARFFRAVFIGVAFCFAFLLEGTPAFAQRNIGSALAVEREVSATLSGRSRSLSTGNGVFQNENIRTANASTAQLEFLDQTRLRIGPSASVVLDRFVFNPDRTVRDETVEVTTGAVRWIGNVSRPGTHKVRTPHAIIGVRGTIFDVLVEARRTIVTLREGVIVVCAIRAPQRCVTLDTPGQTAIATTTAVEGPSQGGPSPTRFADLCLSPIDRASCVFTRTAELEPGPSWGGFYVGVHGDGVANKPNRVGVEGAAGLEAIGGGGIPAAVEARGLGASGGIQAGYLWRVGPGVIGFESDFSALSASTNAYVALDPCACLTAITRASQHLDYLGTFRGRVGVAVGDLLVFGTGGLAVGHIKLDGSISPIPEANPTYTGSRSLTRAGYAVGGGIEFAVGGPLSVRAEFLHYDLGKQTLTLPEVTGLLPAADTAAMQFRTRGDLVRAGINMMFDTVPVLAADLPDGQIYKAPPAAPSYTWTGLYAGAHGGAGWARKDWFFHGLPGIPVAPGDEGPHVATGALAGGQIGANYQVGRWVWGVEGDASWTSLEGHSVSNVFPVPFGNRNISRVDALATLGARLGIAWDRTLLYAKAGGAWASDKYKVQDLTTGGIVSTVDQNRWGWMAGVGLERAFLDSWSVKLEYDYLAFGHHGVGFVCSPVFCTGTASVEIGQNVSVIKLGINYRFGDAITVRY